MPAPPASTEPEADLPPHDPAADAEFYCEMLDEIMQTGIELTRVLRAAVRNDPASLTPATALALERIARTVRRCMLLVRKLTEARPARTVHARSEARARVRAEVQAATPRAPPDSDRPGSEYVDRLDTLGPGTVPEIIAGLCRDLTCVAEAIAKPYERRPRPSRQARPKPGTEPTPATQTTPHHPQPPPTPARSRGSG